MVPTTACPCAISPCRWHQDEAGAEVLRNASRLGQLGWGCGAGVHAVMAPNGACQGAQRCRGPTRAAPASSGSVRVGDRVLPRGSSVAPPLPAEPVSVCPAGRQCQGHGAGCAGWQCTAGGRGEGAWGLFLSGSRQFEYMSRSGFNYSNWLSEGRAGACSGSEGEREWLGRLDAPRAGESLSLPCHLSLAQSHVPTCLQGHGPCEVHTHVGACLSPTPNNLVVAAAGWEVKATLSLGQSPAPAGMLPSPAD